MTSKILSVAFGCVLFNWSTVIAEINPTFVVETQVGQATGSSCQSYVLALGLAFKKDSNFRIQSWSELRTAEKDIRNSIIQAYMKRVPGAKKPDPDHNDVKVGFQNYTSAKYTLKIKSVDLQGLSDVIESRTGVTKGDVIPPHFLVGAVVKDIVMSSADRIGKDPYGKGHIFSIFGMDGPMNSTRKFLILNSAVKIKDVSRNACTDDLPDDPGPYTAELSWRTLDDIKLKEFGGKFHVWLVEKNQS